MRENIIKKNTIGYYLSTLKCYKFIYYVNYNKKIFEKFDESFFKFAIINEDVSVIEYLVEKYNRVPSIYTILNSRISYAFKYYLFALYHNVEISDFKNEYIIKKIQKDKKNVIYIDKNNLYEKCNDAQLKINDIYIKKISNKTPLLSDDDSNSSSDDAPKNKKKNNYSRHKTLSVCKSKKSESDSDDRKYVPTKKYNSGKNPLFSSDNSSDSSSDEAPKIKKKK